MRGHRTRMVACATCLVIAAVALAWAGQTAIFTTKTDEGWVYVNVDLARKRTGEAFIPLLVGVMNNSKQSVVLTRESFRIVMPDGTRLPAASVQQIREGYPKLENDFRWLASVEPARILGVRGVGTVPSHFYPGLVEGTPVVITEVELPPRYWTADLIYLPRPEGFTGGELVLEVAGEGWKAPVLVNLSL